MKVTVWHGCQVVREFEVDRDGPDIDYDPWAKILIHHLGSGVRYVTSYGFDDAGTLRSEIIWP